MITNEPYPSEQPTDLSQPASASVELSPPTQIDPDHPAWAALPWGPVKAFAGWFWSIVCLVVVPMIVVIPYIVYLYVTSGPPQASVLTADKTFLFLSILGVIPAHLLTLVVIWLIVTNGRQYPFWQTVGFSWPPSLRGWRGVGLCVLLALVLLGIGILLTNWFGGPKTQLDQLIESSFQARIATALLAVATGPLIEELVYRGVLYPALARIIGVGGSIAVVSLLFAGVHVFQYKNNIAVIAVIALLSVCLTVVRAVTKRLLPSFVIHFVFNGCQSVVLLLQPFFDKGDHVTPTPAPALILFRLLRHFF